MLATPTRWPPPAGRRAARRGAGRSAARTASTRFLTFVRTPRRDRVPALRRWWQSVAVMSAVRSATMVVAVPTAGVTMATAVVAEAIRHRHDHDLVHRLRGGAD